MSASYNITNFAYANEVLRNFRCPNLSYLWKTERRESENKNCYNFWTVWNWALKFCVKTRLIYIYKWDYTMNSILEVWKIISFQVNDFTRSNLFAGIYTDFQMEFCISDFRFRKLMKNWFRNSFEMIQNKNFIFRPKCLQKPDRFVKRVIPGLDCLQWELKNFYI